MYLQLLSDSHFLWVPVCLKDRSEICLFYLGDRRAWVYVKPADVAG